MCDLHLQIIDCHIHIRGTMSSIANMIDVMRACNLSGMNVLSVASQGGENTTQNVVGLLSKALYPGQMYAFGALQYSLPGDHQNHPSFAEQARRLMQMGADGMKMGEGKPTLRKAIGQPLDSPIYDEYYAFLESIPVNEISNWYLLRTLCDAREAPDDFQLFFQVSLFRLVRFVFSLEL
jgi:hypothetical protein